MCSCIVLPVIQKDQILGTLSLGSRSINAYRESDLPTLIPVASQLAVAIENDRLQEQIQSMAIHVERDRLGRELHDGLGQVLGYIGMKTATIGGLLRQGQLADAEKALADMDGVARSAYADVCEAILGLRSTVTAAVGLEPVLREYLHRFQREWGIVSELVIADAMIPALTPAQEIQLLRIIQEALTNVRKHAHAKHAWIRFEPAGDQVAVTIEDDGHGFDPQQTQREHFGLQTMCERAENVGGHTEVVSAPGQGTRIRVSLPRYATNRSER